MGSAMIRSRYRIDVERDEMQDAAESGKEDGNDCSDAAQPVYDGIKPGVFCAPGPNKFGAEMRISVARGRNTLPVDPTALFPFKCRA